MLNKIRYISSKMQCWYMTYDIHINHLTAQQIEYPFSFYTLHFADDTHIYINIDLEMEHTFTLRIKV